MFEGGITRKAGIGLCGIVAHWVPLPLHGIEVPGSILSLGYSMHGALYVFFSYTFKKKKQVSWKNVNSKFRPV